MQKYEISGVTFAAVVGQDNKMFIYLHVRFNRSRADVEVHLKSAAPPFLTLSAASETK